MHTAARLFEARWGLAEMSPLDRTARRRPVTGEAEKPANPRSAPCTAAALAHDDTDFLDRLRDAGLPAPWPAVAGAAGFRPVPADPPDRGSCC
ncbi:hypothetical protein [Streptomyces erythrochromogenes]|uniref:hypothetical protein n=1 Tax=Streptomyces erythrochromogenes TaxID=285574 RepID=UPI0033F1595E